MHHMLIYTLQIISNGCRLSIDCPSCWTPFGVYGLWQTAVVHMWWHHKTWACCFLWSFLSPCLHRPGMCATHKMWTSSLQSIQLHMYHAIKVWNLSTRHSRLPQQLHCVFERLLIITLYKAIGHIHRLELIILAENFHMVQTFADDPTTTTIQSFNSQLVLPYACTCRKNNNCENFFQCLWWHFCKSLHQHKILTMRYCCKTLYNTWLLKQEQAELAYRHPLLAMPL